MKEHHGVGRKVLEPLCVLLGVLLSMYFMIWLIFGIFVWVVEALSGRL